jgi:DNA-binding FadR family transcriptional regulator
MFLFAAFRLPPGDKQDKDNGPSSVSNDTPFPQSAEKRGVKRRQLVDEVIAELHRLLALGYYKEGDRFPPEPKLGEMLNVSRTTVREAVKVLAKTGRLEVQQGRGTFVVRPTPGKEPLEQRLGRAGLLEINEARRILELGIVRLAAERRTEDDLRVLREVLEKRAEATERGDFQTCVERDIEFHKAMADAGKNRILVDIFAAFTDVLRNSIHQIKEYNIALNCRKILEDHKKLYAAVEAQDTEKAASNVHSYLFEIDRKIGDPSP